MEIQTPMAQGRSTKIISMTKWLRTSGLSIKKCLSCGYPQPSQGRARRMEKTYAIQTQGKSIPLKLTGVPFYFHLNLNVNRIKVDFPQRTCRVDLLASIDEASAAAAVLPDGTLFGEVLFRGMQNHRAEWSMEAYRSTSLIRNSVSSGPYSSTVPRNTGCFSEMQQWESGPWLRRHSSPTVLFPSPEQVRFEKVQLVHFSGRFF